MLYHGRVMKYFPRFRVKLFILAGFLVLNAAAAQAGAKGLISAEKGRDHLVPHKALYDVKMISKRSSAQILNISGQMFFEWRPGCEAWTTNHRFNLLYEYADSTPLKITSDFSTYETFDGKKLEFNSRRKRDGEIYQKFRGHASKEKDAMEALYSTPDGLRFDLDDDVLFPMAHTIEVLRRAKAGEKFYTATIFDGSDEKGPTEVSSFIGEPVNVMASLSSPSSGLDTSLLDAPAWNIRMAFFPQADSGTNPEYEMNVTFHQNGIISDMVVEYPDFSVSQDLVAIEKLEQAKCETP